MSVLVFLDQADGQIRKSSFEAACYGAKVAEQLGVAAEAVVLGNVNEDLASVGKYGVKKVHHVTNVSPDQSDAQSITIVLAELVNASGANVIIFSNNVVGKGVAPRLSVRLKAG